MDTQVTVEFLQKVVDKVFEDVIASANSIGYDMEAVVNSNGDDIYVEAVTLYGLMPDMTVETVKSDKGWVFNPVLSFPELKIGQIDPPGYKLLDDWKEVAELAEAIANLGVYPEEFIDEI